MGDRSPWPRPHGWISIDAVVVRFDYSGALQLAEGLVKIADDAQDAHSVRTISRDEALHPTIFVGPYGDRHREYATLEDDEVVSLAGACRVAADRWAFAWARAVDSYNDTVEQAARARMNRFNELRLRRWLMQRAIEPMLLEPAPQPGIILRPSPAPVPTAPGFTVAAAFARYDFDIDDLVVWPAYHDSP